jgi:hypothetical protein
MMGIERRLLRVGLLGLVLCSGCQGKKQGNADQDVAPPPAPERIAEIKRAEGFLVGEVEAVDTEFGRTAVGGIDPKQVNKASFFLYLDSSTGEVINDGKMYSTTASGRIIVTFDTARKAPKVGDLAAVRRANP